MIVLRQLHLLGASKGDGIHTQSCLPEGKLSHCLHILFGQLHVVFSLQSAKLTQLGSGQAHVVAPVSAITVLRFNV